MPADSGREQRSAGVGCDKVFLWCRYKPWDREDLCFVALDLPNGDFVWMVTFEREGKFRNLSSADHVKVFDVADQLHLCISNADGEYVAAVGAIDEELVIWADSKGSLCQPGDLITFVEGANFQHDAFGGFGVVNDHPIGASDLLGGWLIGRVCCCDVV